MQGIEWTSEQPQPTGQPESMGWAIGARWILLLAALGWGALLWILALVF